MNKRGYASGGEKAIVMMIGVVLILTGFMMLFRIYPFGVPLAMPVAGLGWSFGTMMAWFWWFIGGFIVPILMIYFGGFMVVGGARS